jgi:hypothetical protein
MTHEEKIARRERIYQKATALMDRLERACAEPMGWQEMMDAADILLDLSRVEKNMAKAHHYECGHAHHIEDKKY